MNRECSFCGAEPNSRVNPNPPGPHDHGGGHDDAEGDPGVGG
jgi:hypothetical protein